MRSERSETLQTTALLHEAFIKLSNAEQLRFNDRNGLASEVATLATACPLVITESNHFLAIASRVMRQVLVDYARSRATQKRGSMLHSNVSENFQIAANSGVGPLDVLELDRALDALAAEDESLAQLVELRYFGGMTAQETSDTLGRSVHIIRHELRLAQAWLRRRISEKR